MFYQTHPHPLFFHFKHLSSSIHHLPSAISSLSPLCSSHSSQVEKEMACVEVALKGSFRKEMTLKSNQQALLEDFSTVNGQSGVVSVEDFSVDDLLDFSVMGGAEEDDKEKEEEDKSCVSLSSPQQQLITKESSNRDENLAFKDDFGSNELSVPVDDVANLEWLSHFVEDSFSEYSLPFPAGNLTAKPKNTPEETTIEPPSAKLPCFATPVPAKARTKRTRTGGRRWSFGSTTESSSSSSSSSSSTSSLPSTSWLIYTTPSHIVDSFNSLTRRPAKKQKRRIVSETGGGGGTQPPRRCSHCGVQKTPQWRAGPLGAKTLCNACGVRFKSGRLLPEYRPACSPTFSSEMHSNHHRKVLEMRKKNETVGPEPGLSPAVAIF